MKTLLGVLAVLLISSPVDAACVNIAGRYRVASHATAIVEYRQIGCETLFVRESADGMGYTPERELKIDGRYRKFASGGIHRGWFEASQIRRQYFYFDSRAGELTGYVDHWNEFDANGDLLGWEEIYDLNGVFLRKWESRFIRIP